MSADKDRGIRRQKQKRAKDRKKRAMPQPKPATMERGVGTNASKAPAA